MGRRRSGARADRERRREAEGETGGEKEREASFRDQVCFASCADGCGVNGMWRCDVCGGWLDAGLGGDAVCCVWRCVVPWLVCVACCVCGRDFSENNTHSDP